MSKVRFVDNVGVSAFGNLDSGVLQTGSLLLTASAADNVITFTKGDTSQFNITIDTGSGGFFNTSSLMITASVAGTTMTFTKGDGSTFNVALPGGSGGSGIFNQSGSSDLFVATSSLRISGSTLQPSPYNPSYPDASLTSSQSTDKYAMVVSESVYHYNANVGVPTTKAWKTDLDGSYFNRFDQNTDVSEVLRFVAGLLSASAPDASANTKTFNSIATNYSGQGSTSKDALFNGVLGSNYESGRLSIEWTSSAFINFANTASYKTAQDYFILKGFLLNSETGSGVYGNDTGTNPFNGSYGSNIPNTGIISSFSSLAFTVNSVALGSTLVSSSNDTQLFGLGELNSGNAVEFQVRVLASQSFSDNSSVTTPDQSSNTFFTSSFTDLSISSFGSSNGLTLGKIVPSNATIQPGFQDGKFASVAGTISGRYAHAGSTNSNIISSSGYYRMFDVKSGIKTGSQSDFTLKNGSNSSNSVKFYMPSPYGGSYLGSEGVTTDIISSIPTITASSALEDISFTATSRSLSGAPYLRDISYSFRLTSEVSKSFDPIYGSTYNTANNPITNAQSGWSSVGSPSFTPTTISVTSGGVQTIGATGGVLSADKTTQRGNNDIPHIDDIAFLSSSYSLNCNISSNIAQNSTTPTYPTLTFSTTGRNGKGGTQSPSNHTRTFFDSTRFNQPSDSGSMFIYDQNQDYDGADTLTGKTESFAGENYRIQINNNLLSGSYVDADHFNTSSYNTNNLGDLDLQVKGYPNGSSQGYLVRPGGTYGYWITDPDSTKDYKFYARAFELPSGTSKRSSLSVDVGNTLVNWNSASPGIAVAIMYSSARVGRQVPPAPSPLVRSRIFDVSNTSQSEISTNISQDFFINPFSSAIDLYGISGGSISGNIYNQVLLDSVSAVLNPAFNSFIVLIRYKGDIAPVRRIIVDY